MTAKKTNLSKDYYTTVTILEHLSDAVFILSPEGQIQYANRVALDMLNIELKDILGSHFNAYLQAEFNTEMLFDKEKPELLLENIYRGVFNEIETALTHNEYSTPVIISFGLVRDSGQKISFILASAKDISIRKELEKELQQQQLMTLSRDRYKELGELAVNMVHNISQPLTSLRLMLELMEKQTRAGDFEIKKFKRYFEESNKLLDVMTSSIAHVRNFAFLTEDDTMKSLLLSDMAARVIKQLDYELNEHNVQIDLNIEKNLPPIMANPINMQQAMSTLLRYFWNETETDSAQKISLKIENIQNRWIRVTLNNGISSNPSDGKEISEVPLIGSQLDLTVVQIIMTSLGGDFQMRVHAESHFEFILRIPVDQGAERDQLRNMIELMHR